MAGNLGKRVWPHTHTGSQCLIHIVDSPIRVRWGRGPRVFFFSLPFPIYLLWPQAPANNSTRGSQYCILQTWPHTASGLLQAKKGKFYTAREIESLKKVCLEDLYFLFLPPPTFSVWIWKHQVSAEHRYSSPLPWVTVAE